MKSILSKILSMLDYKKIINKTKSFIKTKKLLSILILAAILASIAVSILIVDKIKSSQMSNIKINKPIFTLSIDPNGLCIYNVKGKIYTINSIATLYKYSGISNFFLSTVSGVYKTKKDYLVYKENLDSLPSSISGTIISDIYSIVPKNGEDILSMQPIYITFRLPGTIDKSTANYQIVRISNSGIIPLKGAYLHSDGSNYYITAKVYHLSKFALKYIGTINIKKQYGLKEVYSVETRGAGRPILIVGGIDKNIYDVDFWMNVFPNRSIWFYYYPTSETRSLIYQSTLDNLWENEKNYIASKYKITLKRDSYIIPQAALLKQDLIAVQKTKKYIKFDIVANGIGGLIARWALEVLPSNGPNDSNIISEPINNVKNLYLVDVPNNGITSIDPNILKDIYGSSNAFIKKQYSILDLEQVKWFSNRLITMLDNYSPFIQDIIPSSTTISILKIGSLDSNVNYYNFCGIKPIFNIKYIPGSRIEEDFPLFVEGKGDGKISIYDANIKGIDLMTLNSNFLQVYQNKNFLNYVKTGYVSKEKTNIAQLQSDIKITTPSASNAQSFSKIIFVDKNVKVVKMANVLKQTYAVKYSCSNFRIFNGKKYFIYASKIVSGNKSLYVKGYISDVAFYNEKLYIFDFSKSILYITNQNLQTLKTLYLSKNSNSIFNITPTRFGIIYYNSIDKTVYILDNSENTRPYIKTNIAVKHIYVSNNKLLIQTKSDIRIFDLSSGNVIMYYSLKDFENIPQSYGKIRSFSNSYLYSNYLYIISDNYTLFAIDLNIPNQIDRISGISESTGRFLNINNTELLVGRKVINAYEGIKRLGWFYKTNFEINDFFQYSNNLYLISKVNDGIMVRKMVPNWR